MTLVLTNFIPQFQLQQQLSEAEAVRQLQRLSKRVEVLTKQVPGLETVRGMLNLEGGSRTGSQYRSTMHVLDLAFVDEMETMRDAVNALLAWYWQAKKVPFLPADYETLQQLRDILYERLRSLALAAGSSMNTPKVHCCAKIASIIRQFGTYQHVSTDSFERAHKAHKAVFQRYVQKVVGMCALPW